MGTLNIQWKMFLVLLVTFLLFKSSLCKSLDDDANIDEIIERVKELNDVDLKGIIQQLGKEELSNNNEKSTDIIEKKGFWDSFLSKVNSLKSAYKSVSFTPKKTIDFIRLGTMAAEVINSEAVAEDSAFGVFTGSIMCLNIFCSPMSVVKTLLFGLSKVSNLIAGTKDGVETMNDQVLKRATSLPAVGTATKVTSRFLDATVIPVLQALRTATKSVTTPLGYAYNVSKQIVTTCTDIKSGMLLANLLTIVEDAKNGDQELQKQLGELSDLFKTECSAIVKVLPTWGLLIKSIYDATGLDKSTSPKEVIDLATGENSTDATETKRGVDMSSLPKFGTVNFLTQYDAVTLGLEEIEGFVDKTLDKLDLFKPIVKFFNAIKRILDMILDTKMCIPLGPYGALLNLYLDVGTAIAEGIVDAVNFMSKGNLASAAGYAVDYTGELGSILEDQLSNVGGVAIEIGSDMISTLGNVYSDVKKIGAKLAKSGQKKWKKLKKAFSGRRKRDVGEQTPNLEYFYKRNMTLNRDNRGLSGNLLAKLADFLENNEICITPRQVLDSFSILMESILGPFEKLASSILEPVLTTLEKMFSSIFPNLGFLDKLKNVSIGMLGIDDLTNLVNIFDGNDLFIYLKDTARTLSSECRKRALGAAAYKPKYTYQEVLCACVDGQSGCANRELELESRQSGSSTGECRYAGIAYQGIQSTTVTGKTCMNWADKDPHDHGQDGANMPEMSLILAENYCRIPNSFPEPWCFTIEPETRWEYCGIPLCTACLSGSSRETTGQVTYTAAGYKCQAWKIQDPHTHSHTGDQFAEASLGAAENFCHNPDNSPTGPWCYTSDIGRTWDVCDVPKCGSFSELLSGYKPYSYNDCPGNDISGSQTISFEDCIRGCESKSNCKAVGYIASNGKCWMKSTCNYNSLKYNSNMITYIKSEAANYQSYNNKDCSGNVYHPVRVSRVKECAQLCNSEPRCLGFLWKASNGLCSLKEFCQVSSLSSSSGNTIYIKDAMQTYKSVSGTDCSGNDLGKQEVGDQKECAFMCSRNPRCVAFLYKNGNCWPKSKCDSFQSNSGDLYFKEVGQFSKYSDRTCYGNGLKQVTSLYSGKACADVCKSTSNCAAFSLNIKTGVCALKKNCPLNTIRLATNLDSFVMNQAPEYYTYMDRNYNGNAIKNVAVTNPAQCAVMCNEDTFCQAFTSQGTDCSLKHTIDVTALEPSTTRSTYVKKSVQYFNFHAFRDCSGNGIKKKTTDTLDNCADMCYRNTMCVAFMYITTTSTTGNCWLKSKCEANDIKTHTTGMLYVRKSILRYERTVGKTCSGNGISDHKPVTMDTCADKCEDKDNCFGFIYKPSDNKCWLKKKCTPGGFSSDGSVAVHVKVDIPGFTLERDVDCPGNDLENKIVDSISQCAALCFGNQICVAFGVRVSNYRCWMKRKCDPANYKTTSSPWKLYIIQAVRPHTLLIGNNKNAYQSTDADKDTKASLAVDGNTEQNFNKGSCTKTAKKKNNPWWGMDLGSTKTIAHVTLYNRGDDHGSRLHDFTVYGSGVRPSGGTPSSLTTCAKVEGSLSKGDVITVTCDDAIDARYVIIRIPGNNEILTLCEVKVYVVG